MTENVLTQEMANFAKTVDLPKGSVVEIVGQWVWIETTSKPEEETRKQLSDAGFRWIGKRQKWAHPCGRPSRPAKYDPRTRYETELVRVA